MHEDIYWIIGTVCAVLLSLALLPVLAITWLISG